MLDALISVLMIAGAVGGMLLYAFVIVMLVTQIINHMPPEGGKE